jgi:hypothetical protein
MGGLNVLRAAHPSGAHRFISVVLVNVFNETKPNETKRNQTKPNETKRNRSKRNETKCNEKNEMKRKYYYQVCESSNSISCLKFHIETKC